MGLGAGGAHDDDAQPDQARDGQQCEHPAQHVRECIGIKCDRLGDKLTHGNVLHAFSGDPCGICHPRAREHDDGKRGEPPRRFLQQLPSPREENGQGRQHAKPQGGAFGENRGSGDQSELQRSSLGGMIQIGCPSDRRPKAQDGHERVRHDQLNLFQAERERRHQHPGHDGSRQGGKLGSDSENQGAQDCGKHRLQQQQAVHRGRWKQP